MSISSSVLFCSRFRYHPLRPLILVYMSISSLLFLALHSPSLPFLDLFFLHLRLVVNILLSSVGKRRQHEHIIKKRERDKKLQEVILLFLLFPLLLGLCLFNHFAYSLS